MPRIRESHITRSKKLFRNALSVDRLDALARETEFVRRQRLVTAASVFWALIVTVGAQSSEYVSDILRTLNSREGWTLRYKPFWNRLSQASFPTFFRRAFHSLCQDLATQVIRRSRGTAVAFFSDILIDDGSSFGVAKGLRRAFPGRFTALLPAAVEVHAHMSLVKNSIISATVAPDKEAERQYLPKAASLPPRSLSLRDRGYIDLSYFEALEDQKAFLICRGRTDMNPFVERIQGVPRKFAKKWEGKRLHQLPRTKLGGTEIIVRWNRRGGHSLRLRLVIREQLSPTRKQLNRMSDKRRRWSKKNRWLYLLTNVPREAADADAVVDLYRLRWQIELVFKDWKSYANLHEYQTTNPQIAEGLIWASLCAALLKRALAHVTQIAYGRAISTRIAAQSGPHLLPLLADWAQRKTATTMFLRLLVFLADNARITHPERKKKRPQHRLGIKLLHVPES